MLEAENLSYFHDIVTDAFLLDWVPWLETAVLSYEAIYSLHPGMQCTRKTYDAARQLTHLDAVRLGHPDGWLFIREGRFLQPGLATPAPGPASAPDVEEYIARVCREYPDTFERAKADALKRKR